MIFLLWADCNITRPKDFEGKTYCGWEMDIKTSLINYIVKADGGDPSKVNIIKASSNLTGSEDECDFIWAYDGRDKITHELDRVELNYIPFYNFGVDW